MDEASKVARFERLAQAETKRELGKLLMDLFPLTQEQSRLDFLEPEEKQAFFGKLNYILTRLSAQKIFDDDPELKQKTEEAIALIGANDLNNSKLEKITGKVYDLLVRKGIEPFIKLP